MTAEVDVLAPCALGGVLNDDTVPALRCRAIAGAANNQLASDALDAALAERGILWAPDFVCNAGGIINIAVELEPDGYSPRPRRHAASAAVGDTLRQIFDSAAASGTTPLQRRARAGPRAAQRRLEPLPLRAASPGARRSVIAANGRTAAGASAHAASSSASSSSGAIPDSSAASSLRSRSARWARYSSSLAVGVVDRVAVPGSGSAPAPARAAARSPSRYSLSRPLTNTLPSPSTASPVKAWPPATNTRWSSAWPGTCEHVERAERVTVAQRPSSDRHAEPRGQLRRRFGVVGVRVREQDARRRVHRATIAVHVRVDQRARVDHPRARRRRRCWCPTASAGPGWARAGG